jgi:hypothetical protein
MESAYRYEACRHDTRTQAEEKEEEEEEKRKKSGMLF